MKERTNHVIELFANLDWFYAVGEPELNTPDVEFINLWSKAIEKAISRRWENANLHEINKLIARVDKERREWEASVHIITPHIMAQIMPKIDLFAQAHNLPESFVQSVRLNMLDIALFTEHADLCPNVGLIHDVAHWYAKGHFPCDYVGRYPKGKLIVF